MYKRSSRLVRLCYVYLPNNWIPEQKSSTSCVVYVSLGHKEIPIKRENLANILEAPFVFNLYIFNYFYESSYSTSDDHTYLLDNCLASSVYLRNLE